MRIKLIIISACLSFLVSACADEPKKKNTQQEPITEEPAAVSYQLVGPVFNADSAYYFTEKQVSFGPRVCNSEAHTLCGDFLVAEFKKYAPQVIEQKAEVKNWDGKTLKIRNIIASFNPKASKRILIAAHWDSRPYADNDVNPANHDKAVLAADDGASGVAVMLEMARAMKTKNPSVGVDFICFDAEDLGKSDKGSESYCLGSQYWSKNKHVPGYKAEYGILLDMVGAFNARFIFEGYSFQYAEKPLRKVWDLATNLGYTNYFYYMQGGYITDDHFFVNTIAGIPMIDIIHYTEGTNSRFPAHWHTVNDNMSIIDRNTLKAVGQTVLETIYLEQ
jgi:Zn-dependent M28 family amino/carboxypeptidase